MPRAVPAGERHVFEPVLARLGAESGQRFGFEPAIVAPVSYQERPFSRLCRATVSKPGAAAPDLHVFIKIFKTKDPAANIDMRDRVVKDFAFTCEIHSHMGHSSDLGVVRPVACYDDLLAIVTEQADGVTLLEAVESHATWLPGTERAGRLVPILESVGRWLRRFQSFRPSDGRISLAELRDYVDVRLARLAEHGAMPADQRQQIQRHLISLAEQVPVSELADVAIHGDVAPANVLVSPRRVVMLDFAMARRGSTLHDISRLHMQLELLKAKPHFRGRVIDDLNAALLRGFDPALTVGAPLFRFLSMLHHVNHFGTLSLHRERFPASLLSARAKALHRRWIASELGSATARR